MSSASEELARRRRVRGALEELSKLCELVPAAHHRYIMKHLEQGDARRAGPPADIGAARLSKNSDGQRAFFSRVLAREPSGGPDRHRQPHPRAGRARALQYFIDRTIRGKRKASPKERAYLVTNKHRHRVNAWHRMAVGW